MSPLIGSESFSQDYNLYELATQLPVQKIVDELIASQEAQVSQSDKDSSFLAIVLPKVPSSQNRSNDLPFANLYSSNKASLKNSFKALAFNRS